MATDDTLTRVRDALARLAEVERDATLWEYDEHGGGIYDGDGQLVAKIPFEGLEPALRNRGVGAAIVALRNAAPALLALAEAVADMVADARKAGDDGRLDRHPARVDLPWWGDMWTDGSGPRFACGACDTSVPEVDGWGALDHRKGCFAVALDAALAALAAPGEVHP